MARVTWVDTSEIRWPAILAKYIIIRYARSLYNTNEVKDRVKGSSTAARVLVVFEAVAANQPVGVAALSGYSASTRARCSARS